MKSLVLLLLTMQLVTQLVKADTVVLAWDASTTPNISKYRVYYGTQPSPVTSASQWIEVAGNILTGTATNVGVGIYYFQATAFIGTLESDPSNSVTYTNKHFGPVNLRITSSTNQVAALWIESVPVNNVALVERSADMQIWAPYASVRVYDQDAGNDGLFLTSILPENAFFWRVQVNPIAQASMLPLPTGQLLRQQP